MTPRIEALLTKIKDNDIRTMLSITHKSGKHPVAALTDGAFEKLVHYIVDLEEKAK